MQGLVRLAVTMRFYAWAIEVAGDCEPSRTVISGASEKSLSFAVKMVNVWKPQTGNRLFKKPSGIAMIDTPRCF